LLEKNSSKGMLLVAKKIQSSPFTLRGGVIALANGDSFTFFSSHCFVVLSEGESV
jgi:hypothetical protein